ncbi:MAG: 2-oxoisovalerate dehydrogenase E2 component (dihydrolipoyl transacylase) [Pseudohongiellaceae bacterium]|jgi:pyruvate dehydrogenase E2 component (dihydrolipoamide acetyltransferase)
MQFKLPDLGEGLQEAEVVEWLVKEGDKVEIDQLVVLVETAKAIVEIPSPVSAVISKICASVGEMIQVNEVLIEYDTDVKQNKVKQKSTSVVGELKTTTVTNTEDAFVIGSTLDYQKLKPARDQDIVAPASIIAFAKKLGVEHVLTSKAYGELSHTDIMTLFESKNKQPEDQKSSVISTRNSDNKLIKLTGAKKIMAQTMSKSCQQVPAVTLFDDANISSWGKEENITLRILAAVVNACVAVPLLNAWFDEENLTIQIFKDINIGVAVNINDGLYVPVIRRAQSLSAQALQETLASLIEQVKSKKIQPQNLLGATISLSNFGTLSGRYATPIIVPPQVAIIGIGKIRDEAVVIDGEIIIARIMPISLTFDHRAASGADASAFLKHFISNL